MDLEDLGVFNDTEAVRHSHFRQRTVCWLGMSCLLTLLNVYFAL